MLPKNTRAVKKKLLRSSWPNSLHFMLSVHCKDVKVHPVLFNSDVLALTETQLFAGESCDEISENLRPFQIYHQDHATDKFSSMAVCIKSTLTMVNQEFIPSLNALKFVLLQNSTQLSRCFLLLYRKNNSNVPQYLEAMAYTLHSFEIDTVLGDFKMNYLSETQCQSLMSLMDSLGYIQIVTEPTFVSSGSLLDRVYV